MARPRKITKETVQKLEEGLDVYKRQRINGAKAHCICIYVDDIDDYEDIENDEDLPF